MKNEKWYDIILLKIIPIFSFIILIGISVYLFNYYNNNNLITNYPNNYNQTLDSNFKLKEERLTPNEIGDSIGGTMSPIIGLMGVILTFLAFYIQYKANNQVQEQFKIQQFEKEILMINEEINQFIYYREENSKEKKNYQGVAAISSMIKDMIEDDDIEDTQHELKRREKYPQFILYLKIISIFLELLRDIELANLSEIQIRSLSLKLSFLKDAKIFCVDSLILNKDSKCQKPKVFEEIHKESKKASIIYNKISSKNYIDSQNGLCAHTLYYLVKKKFFCRFKTSK